MQTALVLAVAIAVAGASCGGFDDTAAPSTESPSTEPAPVVTDPATTEPSTAEPAATAPVSTEPPASSPATTAPATAETVEPETIDTFSSDGELGVSYSHSEGGPDVTIRLLDPAEWPPELAGGASNGAVKIFELEPDGAIFDEPVTVTRRLDITAFEPMGLGRFDVPLVTMLTQNDAGDYELLDDLSIVRVGPDLYVTGAITHFSPIIVSNENRMIPWGPGDGDRTSPMALGETYIDDDEFLSIMRGLIETPPARLVIEGDRYLSGAELFDHVRKVIEHQEAGGDEGSGDAAMAPGFELLDDGVIIDSSPLEPSPNSSDEGAYRAERFGTSFPTIPVSLLPSAGALTSDPDATIDLTVWIPGIVLTPESVVIVPEPTDETPAAESPASEEMADCFMYLEMYPELVELDPNLPSLCEVDTGAARTIISGLLDELDS